MKKLKKVLLWGVGLFLLLGILGAVFGDDPNATNEKEASSKTPIAVKSSPTATSTPTPEPKPQVRLRVADRTIHTDDGYLKGRVRPATAKVKVDGQRVPVSASGRFKAPVHVPSSTLHSKFDENGKDFQVEAHAKGYEYGFKVTTVTRMFSSAEWETIKAERAARRAAIRQEKAARRANSRALESAESYLAMSGF